MAEHASITRRYKFAAMHRLHTDQLSEADNWKVFGKCNNPNGHGHNYVVLVTVEGGIQERTGSVADVGALDRLVHETVVVRFDHRDLNGDPAFADKTTTGENLAILVWDLLVDRIPDARLAKVGVIETRDNYFEYAGPAAVGVQ
ncbi:MAG: 6-carboxytetrahydropterin synthase [Nitrospiraceae bacterium]|nr:6-carboxytetrahydropterin synthase [Nitrospiraceae bacterium]